MHVCRYLKEYEAMHIEANRDPEKFLSNPVNAYLLIKRLKSDWKNVERLLIKEKGRGQLY